MNVQRVTQKTPEDGYRRLAKAVVAYALGDLSGYSPYAAATPVKVPDEHKDSAAWWFALHAHEEWCEVAGYDPDEVKLAAQMIAARVRHD